MSPITITVTQLPDTPVWTFRVTATCGGRTHTIDITPDAAVRHGSAAAAICSAVSTVTDECLIDQSI